MSGDFIVISPLIPALLGNLFNEVACQFKGFGKMKDTRIKLHKNEDVRPIQQVPFHIRDQVDADLEHLEKLDII